MPMTACRGGKKYKQRHNPGVVSRRSITLCTFSELQTSINTNRTDVNTTEALQSL